MTNNIKHLGIVENINGSHIQVRIVQSSACSACSLKGHCSVSESKEKIIDVINDENIPCKTGDEVCIIGSTSMGMKAVALAFVLPFFVLFGALIIALQCSGSEAIAALSALGALIPYYLIIYICRKKLSKTFTFRLERIIK